MLALGSPDVERAMNFHLRKESLSVFRAPLLIAFLPDFSVEPVSAILIYLYKLRFSKLVRLELKQKFELIEVPFTLIPTRSRRPYAWTTAPALSVLSLSMAVGRCSLQLMVRIRPGPASNFHSPDVLVVIKRLVN